MNLALIQESHLSSLARVAADDRIAQTSGVPLNCSEDDARQWMNTSLVPASQEMHYVLLVEGKPAGCCILKKIDWQQREAELSYWLGVEYWGKGLGSRAAWLMADTAFRILGMQTLNAHYLKLANAPSGKILHKLGFTPDKRRGDLKAEGRFLHESGDVWTFVALEREAFS